MKLNLFERFKLLEILPQQGNFVTLKIVRQLREDLSPSEGEYKEYEIKLLDEGRKVKWNPEKAQKEKDIAMGDVAKEVIVTALKTLNDKNELKGEYFTVYEKFIGENK